MIHDHHSVGYFMLFADNYNYNFVFFFYTLEKKNKKNVLKFEISLKSNIWQILTENFTKKAKNPKSP